MSFSGDNFAPCGVELSPLFVCVAERGETMTSTTHRLPHAGGSKSEALDYDRLPEPWREWAKIARNFIWTLDDHQDREDLLHNIIVRLAEVAEVYRHRGLPFNKGACIKVAEYTRLRFYHQKKNAKLLFDSFSKYCLTLSLKFLK